MLINRPLFDITFRRVSKAYLCTIAKWDDCNAFAESRTRGVCDLNLYALLPVMYCVEVYLID